MRLWSVKINDSYFGSEWSQPCLQKSITSKVLVFSVNRTMWATPAVYRPVPAEDWENVLRSHAPELQSREAAQSFKVPSKLDLGNWCFHSTLWISKLNHWRILTLDTFATRGWRATSQETPSNMRVENWQKPWASIFIQFPVENPSELIRQLRWKHMKRRSWIWRDVYWERPGCPKNRHYDIMRMAF